MHDKGPNLAILNQGEHVARGCSDISGKALNLRLEAGSGRECCLGAVDRVAAGDGTVVDDVAHEHQPTSSAGDGGSGGEPAGLLCPDLLANAFDGKEIDLDGGETESLQRQPVGGGEIHGMRREIGCFWAFHDDL